jgi:CheY-like chemotaxis protein
MAPVTSDENVVLVVDDDPAARDLLSRSISRAGFNVATAADGEEGLRLARELKPIAITLDIMMPGKDGWSVLRDLQADERLQEIPVIMATMVDDQNLGYTLGATEYLTKPIDRRQLVGILSRYRCSDPPCRILVVEDEPEIREIERRMLESEGWAVTEAANGREALDALEQHRPELIMLDLMMPVMDGFEFILEMREVEAWRRIPVIVITAKDLTEDDHARLSGEVERIFEKGAMSKEQLLAQLQETLTACRAIETADGTGTAEETATTP